MKNLRGYSEFVVLRNVNDPVMFLGLPLLLAGIYLGVVVFAAILAMIMTNLGTPLIINIAVPGAVAFIGIVGVKMFYRKYGLNGFYFQRKDSVQSGEYECDLSVGQIIRQKRV